jgi:hypothetical protein
VHALRKIHAALAPAGLLVDTQPISQHPRVVGDGAELGRLDMREWLDTIQAVDELIAETIGLGLYEMQHEERFMVSDAFDNGPECLETVNSWRDTRVPPSLVSQLEATQTAITVEQEVRLRLFRRGTPAPG